MPRLSEGGALSSPKIVPTPPIFASLTLALLFDAFSMKIGSSPLTDRIAFVTEAFGVDSLRYESTTNFSWTMDAGWWYNENCVN